MVRELVVRGKHHGHFVGLSDWDNTLSRPRVERRQRSDVWLRHSPSENEAVGKIKRRRVVDLESALRLLSLENVAHVDRFLRGVLRFQPEGGADTLSSENNSHAAPSCAHRPQLPVFLSHDRLEVDEQTALATGRDAAHGAEDAEAAKRVEQLWPQRHVLARQV
eukprot:CAMPEP_0177587376 /NCGR_PEP_ID=MMETSP0419_2-20121207/5613_1 /TAXON_ID=582737 /ORGANISM="Tetraselmis sp., Strain GSL018" /LENGTH=163 /DNA_ID=CAMNT_0019077411 /DNA_START=830 /DNA_END=1321 /DNA_ORIENTATION=-